MGAPLIIEWKEHRFIEDDDSETDDGVGTKLTTMKEYLQLDRVKCQPHPPYINKKQINSF